MDSSQTLSPSRRLPFDKLWLIVGLGIAVRLVFLGLLNLLPEEAYYWNYAKHLDIGYLDHPPMVAWLIYLSESVFGKSEFAVRFPAFLGWFVLALFMYRLADNTIRKGVGKSVLVLLAALPIYVSVGFLMTPDAPLYACWAGALFFLERAIFGNRPYAWYMAGVCLGLGLLSKYTMGLVVLSTVVYLLLDKDSRRWLLRPEPYLALLLGLVVFSPVLLWNAQHEWASFAFQGPQRWSGSGGFHLHILIGSILVLITPLGLYEAIKASLRIWRQRATLRQSDRRQFRRYLFLLTFTLVPLIVFVVHSMQGKPKLNWTGPVWLAVLPLIAAGLGGRVRLDCRDREPAFAKRWLVSASALLVIFACGLSYLAAGMPGLTAQGGLDFPIAWRAYGHRVEEIETRLERETNTEPIVVGMDTYGLSSEASFYDPDAENDSKNGSCDLLPETAGEALFGGNSLMWDLWVSPATAAGRNAVIVSLAESKLRQSWVTRHFSALSEINTEVLRNHSGVMACFYWRVGYNYQVD